MRRSPTTSATTGRRAIASGAGSIAPRSSPRATSARSRRSPAGLVARVDHDGMRSILAKQLNDELGNGDPARAHRVLFQNMLADLEPFAPPGARDAMLLAPGRRFAEALAHNYLERPWLEAVGG